MEYFWAEKKPADDPANSFNQAKMYAPIFQCFRRKCNFGAY